MSKPRVLHIEDDPENRMLVRKLLAGDYELTEAVDGRDGVEKAQRAERPDIVLVDINLPCLDGYEVTLKLRSISQLSTVPIVALTAEGDREMSLAVGCDGFIAKPLDVRTFASTIDQYLNGRREVPADGPQTPTYLRTQSQRIVRHLEEKVAELERANERLTEMDHLREQFYQNISHELSTPLTPVVGYVRLLLHEELGALTPLQRKVLESIASCTERLRGLIENLLDVTALETGQMHFFDREYDFADSARRAVAQCAKLFKEKSLRLDVQIPSDTGRARGDPEKITRAMMTVLDNAAKFTPAGGLVRVAVCDSGDELQFEVVDSGEGIDPTIAGKVFDPFFQADGSSTRTYPGIGLGLALAKRVVDAMCGRICVESPPATGGLGPGGGGARVVFIVPRVPPPKSVAGAA